MYHCMQLLIFPGFILSSIIFTGYFDTSGPVLLPGLAHLAPTFLPWTQKQTITWQRRTSTSSLTEAAVVVTLTMLTWSNWPAIAIVTIPEEEPVGCDVFVERFVLCPGCPLCHHSVLPVTTPIASSSYQDSRTSDIFSAAWFPANKVTLTCWTEQTK